MFLPFKFSFVHYLHLLILLFRNLSLSLFVQSSSKTDAMTLQSIQIQIDANTISNPISHSTTHNCQLIQSIPFPPTASHRRCNFILYPNPFQLWLSARTYSYLTYGRREGPRGKAFIRLGEWKYLLSYNREYKYVN